MRDNRRLRVALALLLVVSITLIVLDLKSGDSGIPGGLRKITGSISSPVQRAVGAVYNPIARTFSNLGGMWSAKKKLDLLQNENDQLHLLLNSSDDARRRAAQLDALLNTAALGQYRVVPARLIAVGSPQRLDTTITIDAGSQDGIEPDMTVLNGQGLVGRTISVTKGTATVQLITDPETTIGSRLERSGQLGFTSGIGSPSRMSFELLDPFAPMATGNRIVTWGSKNGRPYVPGVPIGVITAVRGTTGDLVRSAYLKPFVNFSTLDLVGVVIEPPRTNPRDSVLPKKLPVMATPVRKCYYTVPNPNPNPGSSANPSPSPSFTQNPTVTPTPKLVCVWTVPTKTGALPTPTPKPKKS
jgi:rod shape-determining protein MreC